MKKHRVLLVYNTKLDDVKKELLFIAHIMTVFIAAQGIIIFILYVLLSKQVRSSYLKWWYDKQVGKSLKITKMTNLSDGTTSHFRVDTSVEHIYDSIRHVIKESDLRFTESVFHNKAVTTL
ncbi:PREDICTED: uncharacterized protein LOC109588304 isoform X2 [Amphimedon queenslandica]|uniref:Uncharacterized protein n=1 Tax=Amphimedon queenslandica TaxID=400682 RepID=A0AAN0JT13_AMPQE|nr:PREDICTED: uncharacterized protein LOC109588304 isoform X2 [Amphimedon queenslandica]|eukprot:XP_019860034.1 PREDICTED: uncharacterized protein LOC109588304 isoform X2 [Amphimedon queenslandica]